MERSNGPRERNTQTTKGSTDHHWRNVTEPPQQSQLFLTNSSDVFSKVNSGSLLCFFLFAGFPPVAGGSSPVIQPCGSLCSDSLGVVTQPQPQRGSRPMLITEWEGAQHAEFQFLHSAPFSSLKLPPQNVFISLYHLMECFWILLLLLNKLIKVYKH